MKAMKCVNIALCLLLISFIASGIVFAKQPTVKPGIDVLKERGFDILKGKKIGLITNPTGVTSDLQSTIDVLFNAPGVTLFALYGPEHGVRGDADAGQKVENNVDPATGLPIFSLYSGTRKPTKEMLEGIDILVYDIQDIGVRAYTYISSLGLVMEAAAENRIPLVVLDRPNPLTGTRVEGPMLDLKFKSFVGAYQIPYQYGMTCGELAQMINGEGWLANGVQCKLTVVPMSGWKRSMWWDDTGLSWVPTSAHIPHSDTPIYSAMTGQLGELFSINHGVGYTQPFELIGAPWINSAAFAKKLNSLKLEGVTFRPVSFVPFYRDTTKQRHKGVQIHITDREKIYFTSVELNIMSTLLELYPTWNIFDIATKDRTDMFDKVYGTSEVRESLQKRVPVIDMLKKYEKQCEQFKPKREKYLLY